jgi:tetratricopeptide (TPR) repeat protein
MKATSQAGNSNFYDSMLPRLESLKPETSLDYLMLGAALFLDPGRAITYLDKGVELGQGPVSRLLRAESMLNVVPMTAELADARKAVDDAEFANSLLQNNPLALATSLAARLWEARLLEGKDESRRLEVIELARAKYAALINFTNIPAASDARRNFLDYTGDEAGYEREIESAYRHMKNNAIFPDRYATMLFAKGEVTKALQILNEAIDPQKDSHFIGFMRPIYIADATGDLVQAAEAYANIPDGIGIWDVFYKHAHLMMLGQSQKALEELRKSKDRFETMIRYRDGWYEHFFRFSVGEIDEAALLQNAGKSLLSLCEAHYLLALTKASKGDKAGAKRHFHEAVNTRVFQYGEYVWARVFSKRMDADPNWPRWIPTKNED